VRDVSKSVRLISVVIALAQDEHGNAAIGGAAALIGLASIFGGAQY
jgi:hypothetical protein